MTPVIPIVKFDGEHYFLSNFYSAPVTMGKVTFQNNEAAFQAAKYKAMTGSNEEKLDYIRKVLEAPGPSKAKYAGKSVDIDLDKWESIKVRCMREIVKAKFDQNEDIRLKLIETGAALLVEGNTHKDIFWGRCEGRGANVLGSILMELRGYYLWKEYVSVSF